MKNLLSLASLLLVLGGCNIDFNLQINPSDIVDEADYTGYWYAESQNALQDAYLELQEDGVASLRLCTVNDGYKPRYGVSMSYSGNQLVSKRNGEIADQSTLSVDGDTLTSVNDARTDTYTKSQVIPDVCENDAVEMTLVTPNSAIEGVETEFSVDFNYRLSSSSTAKLWLAYTIGDSSFHSDNAKYFDVTAMETSSGSLIITTTPKIFESGAPFQLALFMGTEDGVWATAMDVATITVPAAEDK